MLIIVKKNEKNDLIEKEKDIVYLNSICILKTIKGKHHILVIDDVTLNNDGFIEEKNYFLDEILITIPIDTIISIHKHTKLEEICKFYHINLIVI